MTDPFLLPWSFSLDDNDDSEALMANSALKSLLPLFPENYFDNSLLKLPQNDSTLNFPLYSARDHSETLLAGDSLVYASSSADLLDLHQKEQEPMMKVDSTLPKSTVGSHLSSSLALELSGTSPSRFDEDAILASLPISNKATRWKSRLQDYLAFRKHHGHGNVPQSDGRLGAWVNHQRSAGAEYVRQGYSTRLTDWQYAALQAIDFEWAIPRATWEDRYQELLAFRRETGHVRVPTKPMDGSMKTLGRWVTKQRSDYRHGRLSAEQVERLNQVRFEWNGNEKKSK